jgi:hypothetical protein
MRTLISGVAGSAISLLFLTSAAEAACGATCQAKCRIAVGEGVYPSYEFCIQKWGGINAKGKAYSQQREAEERARWQGRR